jgi:hypothetical protein
MADEEKIGTLWRDDELDAIVADYFDMLQADLSRQPYIKSRHSAALMAQIGRTHRSVDFKHQNISAVLDELGMPWIPGYKPKRNYQNAIFDAIDRYLSKHPTAFETVAASPPAPPSSAEVFVAPPPLDAASLPIPAGLMRLVRKFDPVERELSKPITRPGGGRIRNRNRAETACQRRTPGLGEEDPMDRCGARRRSGLRYSLIRFKRARKVTGGKDHPRICTYAVLFESE